MKLNRADYVWRLLFVCRKICETIQASRLFPQFAHHKMQGSYTLLWRVMGSFKLFTMQELKQFPLTESHIPS